MKVAEFDFDLPADRIAQEPAARRDRSRLMILDRTTGRLAHRSFEDLPGELGAGDLLVLNDTKVVPARLRGTKPTGGAVEVLLVEGERGEGGRASWRAMISGAKSIRPGMRLALAGGLTATAVEREGEIWRVTLEHGTSEPASALAAVGEMPLPPYIRREADDPRAPLDRERYQTVFARVPGAIAAPTAGLHFTPELFARLGEQGVEIAFVTLHVGLGTFAPVRATEVAAHRMHEESFVVPDATAEAVSRARARNGRVVAVGTTVARTLETRATDGRGVEAGSGRSSLFIYPGFTFRVVDALVTNFHLPQSTLLMLVCAFAGTEPTLAAYREAVREGYRFFSYGDAMLLSAA